FMGSSKKGAFDIAGDDARSWLKLPNPHGKSNANVIKPLWNGLDLVKRQRDVWVIDFGVDLTEQEAALYETPFDYVVRKVRPTREKNNRAAYRKYWWRHAEARPSMRKALFGLQRYIATPEVAKHRVFAFIDSHVLPDQKLQIVTRSDDTTLGVLSSRIHELWALANGSLHGVGNDPRYTLSTTFETFPFPDGLTPDIPAADYADDPRAQAIAAAAKALVEARDRWLNPPE